jgi:hypothetical protein
MVFLFFEKISPQPWGRDLSPRKNFLKNYGNLCEQRLWWLNPIRGGATDHIILSAQGTLKTNLWWHGRQKFSDFLCWWWQRLQSASVP